MIAFCIALFFVQIWQVPTNHKLPIRRPNLIRTALSQATNTEAGLIHIQATLAAQAQIQAMTEITASIGAGKILYYNAMNQKSAGWINDGNQCYFTPQGYHVHTGLAHAVAWCYSNQQSFANIVMSVQVQMHYGDFSGLVFRLNPYYRSFYVLELNSYGEYRLQRALGNDPARWLTLIDWTNSSAIRQGYGQSNTMLVIATRDHFRIYINKQLAISTFIDGTYTAGLIGLLVGGDSIYGTEAVFKQLVIFQKD